MDEDLWRCCKCEKDCLKTNFQKSKNMSDGLHPQCIYCRKVYYNENREKTRKYYSENRDKIRKTFSENRDQINTRMNEYFKNRIRTDVNFRLIRNTRRRIDHALNDKSKSSSTKEILGIDTDTYKLWIEFQMAPEMNWSNIEIDHVKPISSFDISDDEQLKEAFNWRNAQLL